MKIRIIKRTHVDGKIKYVIQKKYTFFKWSWWVDASFFSVREYCEDEFDSFEVAEANLCYFDGSKNKDEVVK